MTKFTIPTKQEKEVVDITDRVAELVDGDGVYTLFAHHTTVALSCADLDPGTDKDMLEAFYNMVPEHGKDIQYRHPHNPIHTPDHILAALIGPDVTFFVENGTPKLGEWQKIVLFEFDGPQERNLILFSCKSS